MAYTAITIAVSYIVGSQNGKISAEYQLYTTPPGVFFSIWGLIYFGMMVVNLMNLYYNMWNAECHSLILCVNSLLMVWGAIFDIGSDAAVFSASGILLIIVPLGLLLWIEMGKAADCNWFIIVSRNVYAFFLGWIIAAANLAIGIWIVYWWGASKETQAIIFWVMAPLCAIGATYFNYSREKKQGLYSCLALWASVAWAFAGAGINSNHCLNGTGGNC